MNVRADLPPHREVPARRENGTAIAPIEASRKPSADCALRQERLDLLPQREIVAAGDGDECLPLARIPVECGVARLNFHTTPAHAVCHRSTPSSSRSSQSFASRQSRLTVCGRNVKHLSRLLDAQAAEEPQLNDPALPDVVGSQCL